MLNRNRRRGRAWHRAWLVAWLAAACALWTSVGGSESDAARERMSVSIVAGGDILLDRGVRAHLTGGADPHALLAPIAAELRAADLAMANLECALVDSGVPIYKVHMFRGDPAMAGVLADAGLDVLSLANNHAYDYGRGGILETAGHLSRAGIRAIGAGPNSVAAFAPEVIEVQGLRVALLGYVDLVLEGLLADALQPGPAHGDRDRLVQAVRDAARIADFVIAQIHWGSEYAPFPSQRQEDLAADLVAAGADLILGHHPHVIQPLEWIGGALVFYSLGNLVFDGGRPGSAESILARVEISSNGSTGARIARVAVLPLRIEACRPSPAGANWTERILARVDPQVTPVWRPTADGWWTHEITGSHPSDARR